MRKVEVSKLIDNFNYTGATAAHSLFIEDEKLCVLTLRSDPARVKEFKTMCLCG